MNQEDYTGVAAAAPADDIRRGGAATDTGLLSVCPECSRAFRSTRGLSQQQHRVHLNEYHAENVPIDRQNACWDHEELLVLARAEIVLRWSGVRNINQRLVQITPSRTLDAIKGVRKSMRYQELLASLQREADSSELIERHASNPNPGDQDDIPYDSTPGPQDHSLEWAEEVRDVIFHLGVPDGIDIHAIVPGSPTRQTREMLNAEYARWLPPLVEPRERPPRHRTGAPRIHTEPVRNARARHRAAYARTQ